MATVLLAAIVFDRFNESIRLDLQSSGLIFVEAGTPPLDLATDIAFYFSFFN